MSHGHHHHVADGILQPTVFVLETTVDLSVLPEAQIRTALTAFITAFLDDLSDRGCRLVGHVKGAVCDAAGCLYFNATSFRGGVQLSGGLPRGSEDCRLTLNAIVYTIEHEEVERAAQAALHQCLGRSGA